MNFEINFKEKYLKYKQKYLNLKNSIGASEECKSDKMDTYINKQDKLDALDDRSEKNFKTLEIKEYNYGHIFKPNSTEKYKEPEINSLISKIYKKFTNEDRKKLKELKYWFPNTNYNTFSDHIPIFEINDNTLYISFNARSDESLGNNFFSIINKHLYRELKVRYITNMFAHIIAKSDITKYIIAINESNIYLEEYITQNLHQVIEKIKETFPSKPPAQGNSSLQGLFAFTVNMNEHHESKNDNAYNYSELFKYINRTEKANIKKDIIKNIFARLHYINTNLDDLNNSGLRERFNKSKSCYSIITNKLNEKPILKPILQKLTTTMDGDGKFGGFQLRSKGIYCEELNVISMQLKFGLITDALYNLLYKKITTLDNDLIYDTKKNFINDKLQIGLDKVNILINELYEFITHNKSYNFFNQKYAKEPEIDNDFFNNIKTQEIQLGKGNIMINFNLKFTINKNFIICADLNQLYNAYIQVNKIYKDKIKIYIYPEKYPEIMKLIKQDTDEEILKELIPYKSNPNGIDDELKGKINNKYNIYFEFNDEKPVMPVDLECILSKYPVIHLLTKHRLDYIIKFNIEEHIEEQTKEQTKEQILPIPTVSSTGAIAGVPNDWTLANKKKEIKKEDETYLVKEIFYVQLYWDNQFKKTYGKHQNLIKKDTIITLKTTRSERKFFIVEQKYGNPKRNGIFYFKVDGIDLTNCCEKNY